MIKKSAILFVFFIFTSMEILCEPGNSWYGTFKEYMTARNSLGIGLFTLSAVSLGNSISNYRKSTNYKVISPFLKSSQNNSKNHKCKAMIWGSISLASFVGSVYCLKNNFY